jgi:hypothetical protein
MATLSGPGAGTATRAAAQMLDLCDRALKELGRRQHIFSWLRAPEAGPEEWLQVDAYYPANRLVVVLHEHPGPYDHLYSELVPAHGLRLLELEAADIDGGEFALMQKLAALGPAPRRAQGADTGVLGPPAVRARKHEQRHPSAQAGLVLGVALAAVLLVEGFAGVVVWALDGGHLVLAFGLALDVCARGLGTLAATRAGRPEWEWLCALGGSPLVAGFAARARQDPDTAETAPLAGLISAIALAALAIALLAALL